MPSPKLTVGQLLERMRENLQLEQVPGTDGLDREIKNANASSPGLVLSGYVQRFPAQRLQVLGETEMSYLASLDAETRRKNLETFFSFPIPCVFITKAQQPGPDLVAAAVNAGVAVIRSQL